MAGGGILQIAGLLALLIAACELGLRFSRGGSILPTGRRWPRPDPLHAYPPAGETPCLWPRLEPDVELLRRKGAL